MTSNQSVKLSFFGDVSLSKGVQNTIKANGLPYIFQHLKELSQDADLRIANFECCVVEKEQDSHKAVLTVDKKVVENLKSASHFDVVNLANNHIMDAGVDGLTTTLAHLQAQQIHYFGAGMNIAEACQPEIITVKGYKIAFIGACDISRLFAGQNFAGVAPWYKRALIAQVKSLTGECDIVIANLHADLEFTDFPQPNRVTFSRQLIEAGAHAVIQHHPHVVQGVEHYQHGVIAYSLGNCVFQVKGNEYQQKWAGTDVGAVLTLTVDMQSNKPDISYQVEPFLLGEQHCPIPMSAQEKSRWQLHFEQISHDVTNRDKVIAAWKARVRREAKRRFGDLYWILRRGNVKKLLTEVKHMLCSPEERQWLIGLVKTAFK